MKKVSLIVYQSYLEDVIKKLHEEGTMEIIDISKEDPKILEDLEKGSMHPDAEICSNYDLRLSRLIDILDKIKPKQTGIKSIISPEIPKAKTVEECSLDEIFSYAEGVLDSCEKNILNSEKRVQEINEKISLIKSQVNQIKYFKDFNLDLADLGTSEYISIKAGKATDLSEIKNDLNDLKNIAIYSKQFGHGKNVEWSVIVVAHISELSKLEKVFRDHVVEFDFEEINGSPSDVIKNLKREASELLKEKKKVSLELRKYAIEQLNDLLAIREEIRIEGLRKEISKNFVQTNSTYLIQGWSLEKNQEDLKKALNEVSKEKIICAFETPSPNPDNPPTHIQSPAWADGFKSLLEMFATPKYNEIDPTVIMGIFFVLFFGVMLGDAGYGIIILLLSLVGYFVLGKNSGFLKSWSFMGIWMGVVTTIFGLLTNSFFGNLMPLFIYGDETALLYNFTLFGINVKPMFDPIKDPLTILTIALIFGLIHLNVGIVLGIIQKIKTKEYKEMLTHKFCWIPLQIGGGILIANIILGWETSQLFIPAAVLVLVGIVLLFIGAGPIGFFDITGYVGDWLSYARLLALGLATSGMALAFNVVSQLFAEKMIPAIVGMLIIMALVGGVLKLLKKLSKPIALVLIGLTIVFGVFIAMGPSNGLGILFKTLLLVVMLAMVHIVNLALQALGAGVHSLRLQYVEFFNRFYEGGGHSFSPFKTNRKYTQIKDEKIE